ncbi:hypothetical protein [Streptomyces sp. Ac-502]|uniref:hypothetical protein n=1 Tax=Streptomyces sp. Ac-502 TaxID=3342801 RepID=UPI0038624E65
MDTLTRHRNIRLNSDLLYPIAGDFAGMLGLSAQQVRESGAAHELGHAVAHLAQDAGVEWPELDGFVVRVWTTKM